MSLQIDPPVSLGQTYADGGATSTTGASWAGVVKLFPDVNPITGRVRSARVKKCVLVRNSSGVTLFPAKRGLSFAAGSISAVDGYHRTDGTNSAAVAGVGDEYLPSSGVAANDLFWVTIEGPTEILVASTTVTADDILVAATAGTTAKTSSSSAGGYAVTANATTAQGVTAIGVVYGRALSAAATGNGCLALVGPRTLGD